MAAEPTLADVGEFALIARLAEIVATAPARIGDVGIGDDAAVVALGGDPRVVATTDLLVEGRHFRLDWSSAYDIGRKAAAQNIADLEAMGARPVSLLVGFGAPGTTPLRFAEDLARGLVDEARLGGAVVSGGDTVGSEHLVISITALGALDGRAPVLRSGARTGDAVYLVGRLGRSAAGLALFRAGDAALLDRHPDVVAAHWVPTPPYGYGAVAAAAGATAMIDVSDGLLADLSHVLDASAVGADLISTTWRNDEVDAAASELGTDAAAWYVGGGEDHALLMTMPAAVDPPEHDWLRRIGSITEPLGVRIDGVEMQSTGFDHFLPA